MSNSPKIIYSKIAEQLRQWNRQHFGHIEMRKRRLWARIAGVHKALTKEGNNHMIKLEKKL